MVEVTAQDKIISDCWKQRTIFLIRILSGSKTLFLCVQFKRKEKRLQISMKFRRILMKLNEFFTCILIGPHGGYIFRLCLTSSIHLSVEQNFDSFC